MLSDNIDIEVGIDPLLNNFGSDSVVFFFFPSLGSCIKISIESIYYISDLLLLEHGLGKIGPLRPIFKITELLSLAIAVVVFVRHLEGGKKCSTGEAKRTSDLIT